jgi:hypothetical protein
MIADGRFVRAGDGDWWYEKHVINAGLFIRHDRYRFLSSEPSSEFKAPARL